MFIQKTQEYTKFFKNMYKNTRISLIFEENSLELKIHT